MNEFMKAAIDQAEQGICAGHGGPFGCVIVKDGQMIGKGHNEVIKNADPTCHGEIMAIRDACKSIGTHDLSGCELYTTAEPCPMCRGAIMWANIARVYYGCNINDTEEIGFRDKAFYGSDFDIATETDREECLKVFEKYKAIQDKKSY
ncbi:MAG: nucleoside deaminase [Ruminococcus sp.]|nr:nucleoside deaminase [Ruminococcus sp.]